LYSAEGEVQTHTGAKMVHAVFHSQAKYKIVTNLSSYLTENTTFLHFRELIEAVKENSSSLLCELYETRRYTAKAKSRNLFNIKAGGKHSNHCNLKIYTILSSKCWWHI
jgi:hypothetical protein